MAVLDRLIRQAPESIPARRLLSLALRFVVPFNQPHGLSIEEFRAGVATVSVPFKKNNKNHLGTVHACVIAAAGEYAAGLAIISVCPPSQYRVIIRDLNVHYLLQGRSALTASCNIESAALELMRHPPSVENPREIQTLSEVHDLPHADLPTAKLPEGGHPQDNSHKQLIATVAVTWQIRPWN